MPIVLPEEQAKFVLPGLLQASRFEKSEFEISGNRFSISQGELTCTISWERCTGLWINHKYTADYMRVWHTVLDYYRRRVVSVDRDALMETIYRASGNTNTAYMCLWLATLGLPLGYNENWSSIISSQRDPVRTMLYQSARGQEMSLLSGESICGFLERIPFERQNAEIFVVGKQKVFFLWGSDGLTEMRCE